MPAAADLPRYEAFLIQPDAAMHWVVAIVRDSACTKARRFARLDDPTGAARLADALNSRLLARRNHHARLHAALDGLPLTVHGAVRHVPTGQRDNPPLLAECLSGDPIDGLLLFPLDCPQSITPRTALAIACAAEDVADECHEAAQAGTSTVRHVRPRLPALLRRQHPEQLLRVADDLDHLAATLRDGLPPHVRTPGDRLAARLAIDTAEQSHTEKTAIAAERSRLLPVSPHDHDFAAARHRLLGDAGRRAGLRIT